jgi:hypothetical protein
LDGEVRGGEVVKWRVGEVVRCGGGKWKVENGKWKVKSERRVLR